MAAVPVKMVTLIRHHAIYHALAIEPLTVAVGIPPFEATLMSPIGAAALLVTRLRSTARRAVGLSMKARPTDPEDLAAAQRTA
jgi:hypothetical protein